MQDPHRALRALALKSLARRSLTVHELRQRLLRTGAEEPGVEATLAWLAREGLVDDAALAARQVELAAERAEGPLRLVASLRARGVDPDTIRAALSGAQPEAEAAARAAERYLRTHPGLDDGLRRRRLGGFLRRRGFHSDVIAEVVGEDD